MSVAASPTAAGSSTTSSSAITRPTRGAGRAQALSAAGHPRAEAMVPCRTRIDQPSRRRSPGLRCVRLGRVAGHPDPARPPCAPSWVTSPTADGAWWRCVQTFSCQAFRTLFRQIGLDPDIRIPYRRWRWPASCRRVLHSVDLVAAAYRGSRRDRDPVALRRRRVRDAGLGMQTSPRSPCCSSGRGDGDGDMTCCAVRPPLPGCRRRVAPATWPCSLAVSSVPEIHIWRRRCGAR